MLILCSKPNFLSKNLNVLSFEIGIFSEVSVAQSLDFCVVFYRSLTTNKQWSTKHYIEN